MRKADIVRALRSAHSMKEALVHSGLVEEYRKIFASKTDEQLERMAREKLAEVMDAEGISFASDWLEILA